MNINAHNKPAVGQFGVVRTSSFIGAFIRLMTRSQANHAFVVVAPATGSDWWIVEAQPGGARWTRLSDYADCEVVFSDLDLSSSDVVGVVNAAIRLVGVPYNFLDIAALFLLLLGWRANPILARAQRMNRLICSQLVDRAYRQAGIHLYADGRPDGEVTPGDLLMFVAQSLDPVKDTP